MSQPEEVAREILSRDAKKRATWVRKRLKNPGDHRDTIYEVLTRKDGRQFAEELSASDLVRIYTLIRSCWHLFTSRQQRKLSEAEFWRIAEAHLEGSEMGDALAEVDASTAPAADASRKRVKSTPEDGAPEKKKRKRKKTDEAGDKSKRRSEKARSPSPMQKALKALGHPSAKRRAEPLLAGTSTVGLAERTMGCPLSPTNPLLPPLPRDGLDAGVVPADPSALLRDPRRRPQITLVQEPATPLPPSQEASAAEWPTLAPPPSPPGPAREAVSATPPDGLPVPSPVPTEKVAEGSNEEYSEEGPNTESEEGPNTEDELTPPPERPAISSPPPQQVRAPLQPPGNLGPRVGPSKDPWEVELDRKKKEMLKATLLAKERQLQELRLRAASAPARKAGTPSPNGKFGGSPFDKFGSSPSVYGGSPFDKGKGSFRAPGPRPVLHIRGSPPGLRGPGAQALAMRGDPGRQVTPRPAHKTLFLHAGTAAGAPTAVVSSAAALTAAKGNGKGGQKLQGLLSIAKNVHMAELEKKKKELEELKARRLGGNLAAAFAPKPAGATVQASAAGGAGGAMAPADSDAESSDDIPEELLQAALERKREAEAQGRPDQPLLPQLQEELARLNQQQRSRDAGFLMAAAERPRPRAQLEPAPGQGTKRTSDGSKKSSKSRKSSKHKREAYAPMNLVSSDEETLRDFPMRLARGLKPAKPEKAETAAPCPECAGRGRDGIGLTCLACRGHGEERPNS